MPEERLEKVLSQYIAEYNLNKILNEKLISQLRMLRLESYTTILCEQTTISHLYFLVEGEIQCATYHPNGTLAVVAILTPFNVIGDVEIMGTAKTSSTVITTCPSVLLGLPVSAVQQHGMNDPSFLHLIIDQLTIKLQKSTSLRLGHLLPLKSQLALYIITQSESQNSPVVILPEKEVLASMLGTSYRHLNRVMKELISQGAIGTGYPGVRVKSKELLSRLI
jgi:CRP/FNR family transcriptional regulator, putaive post-exponential-phase nitrogen-starvation regulator